MVKTKIRNPGPSTCHFTEFDWLEMTWNDVFRKRLTCLVTVQIDSYIERHTSPSAKDTLRIFRSQSQWKLRQHEGLKIFLPVRIPSYRSSSTGTLAGTLTGTQEALLITNPVAGSVGDPSLQHAQWVLLLTTSTEMSSSVMVHSSAQCVRSVNSWNPVLSVHVVFSWIWKGKSEITTPLSPHGLKGPPHGLLQEYVDFSAEVLVPLPTQQRHSVVAGSKSITPVVSP